MSNNFCPNWMKYGQYLKIYIHNIQDFLADLNIIGFIEININEWK